MNNIKKYLSFYSILIINQYFIYKKFLQKYYFFNNIYDFYIIGINNIFYYFILCYKYIDYSIKAKIYFKQYINYNNMCINIINYILIDG